MTVYKTLQGYRVKYLSSDPSNSQYGDIWYNSIEKKIKFTGNAGGAWASGGNLNTARWNCRATVGTQTAGITFAGYTQTGSAMAETEEYNGTSWSEVNDLPDTVTDIGGGGTQTAAFMSGGNSLPGAPDVRIDKCLNYDGTSWTESGDLPFVSGQGAGCGTQTAGIHSGGLQNPGNNVTNKTGEYNGTSWTDGGDYPKNHGYHSMTGTQTATLSGMSINPGESPNQNAEFYEYNGSSWTAAGNSSIKRYAGGSVGTQTAGLIFGGGPTGTSGAITSTESYNGSSFTTEGDLATGGNYLHGGGTGTSALCIGGSGPAGAGPNQAMNHTQEWDSPPATGGVRSVDVS
jgi:hypothetical protein